MTEPAAPTVEERLVRVTAGSVTLEGDVSLPEGARGIVLFAHGSRQQSAQLPQPLCGSAAQ
jgi:putative phosphoribosyl transferase